MDNVIETDEFEKRRIRMMYTRLRDGVAERKDAIESNPWPFLDDAAKIVFNMREALQGVKDALLGISLAKITEDPAEILSIEADLMNRQCEALKIINDAKI